MKIPEINQIQVKLNGVIVGKIAKTNQGIAAFEYDTGFIQNGFSISPFYLPLRPGVFVARSDPFGGLFGVFSDSLPDGWGMLLTDRFLKKIGINPFEINFLQRLALVGSTGNGALTYQPHWSIAKNQKLMDLPQIAREVEKILQQEESANLMELYAMAGSSGGAQPKVSLKTGDSEWIIKFPSSTDLSDIGNMEYQYALSAKKCGIEMTEVRLFENRFFGSKRFDRIKDEKIHVHSASGLLYASHRYPSLDYTELIKASLVLTKNMQEALKIFRQMVFNVLTGNKDDHARNFSFIYKNNGWMFSPAYDLVLSHGFNGQHTTTIAGNGKPVKEDIFTVGAQTGIPRKKMIAIVDEVFENSRGLIKTYGIKINF